MSPLLHHRERTQEPVLEPRAELTGTVLRLSVYLADGEQYHHKPAYAEIVIAAHRAGLAGASVLHGLEGFGRSSRMIHTSRLLDLADNLPLIVVAIDTPERIRAFLPTLREISPNSLATLDSVELVAHVTNTA